MRKVTRSMALRVLAAATFGLVMAGMSFVVAFQAMHTASPYEDMHRAAFQRMTYIMQHLEGFHKQSGRYPHRLVDLKGTVHDCFDHNDRDQILDPWNHPLEYWSDGERYTLRSLGFDGKPGGKGLNKDLDSRKFVRREDGYDFSIGAFRPTLWQFTFNLNTAPSKFTCALAGLFTGTACFVTLSHLRDVQADVNGIIGVLIRFIITLLACGYITFFITMLHVPNGH